MSFWSERCLIVESHQEMTDIFRHQSRYAHSQWETSLQYSDVSHRSLATFRHDTRYYSPRKAWGSHAILKWRCNNGNKVRHIPLNKNNDYTLKLYVVNLFIAHRTEFFATARVLTTTLLSHRRMYASANWVITWSNADYCQFETWARHFGEIFVKTQIVSSKDIWKCRVGHLFGASMC